ncbi:hypothetical protein Btru_010152 [Bulinus truncatus]|nr:hypothetical protein Btru_010152 [Bulinus truncatus]
MTKSWNSPGQVRVKQSSVKQSSVKQSRVKQSIVKQSNVKQSSVKQSRVKQSSVKQSSVKQSSVKQSRVKQSIVKQSSVKQSSVKQSSVKQSSVKQSRVIQYIVKQSRVNILGGRWCCESHRHGAQVEMFSGRWCCESHRHVAQVEMFSGRWCCESHRHGAQVEMFSGRWCSSNVINGKDVNDDEVTSLMSGLKNGCSTMENSLRSPMCKEQRERKELGINPSDFKNAVEFEIIRINILKRLNMTRPPSLLDTESLPTMKELDTRPPVNQRPPNRTTIFSEASASQRLDTMSFRLSPKITFPVDEIKSATLVVRLKALKNNKNQKKLRTEIEDKTELAEKIGNLTKNRKLTEEMRRKLLQKTNEISRIEDISKQISGLPNFSRGNKVERRNRMRQLDQPLAVKVVVRVVDESTGKRKRIKDAKIQVKKTTMMKVDLMKEVAEALLSPNHTLTLQVTCKRCKQRVQMENVFKTPKNGKTGKNAKRLNPQRPYLVITSDGSSKNVDTNEVGLSRPKRQSSKNVDTNEVGLSRPKRQSSKNVDTNEVGLSRPKRQSSKNVCSMSFEDFDRSKGSLSSCCSVKVYVTFKQLGLGDVVVSPEGFFFLRCLKDCRSLRGTRSNNHSATGPSVGQYTCRNIQRSSLDIQYFNNETSSIIPGRLNDLTDGVCRCFL